MSTPARTPSAGMPGAVWPPRPTAPAGPPPRTTSTSGAPPAVDVPADVPAEERPLDPRTIARASLAAGSNRSLWWTMSGILASVGVAYVADAVVGTYALALLLVVAAVARGVGRAPGPTAVAVRSKPLDVAVLLAGAVALVVLASVLPTA